jgi:hypothetical protein
VNPQGGGYDFGAENMFGYEANPWGAAADGGTLSFPGTGVPAGGGQNSLGGVTMGEITGSGAGSALSGLQQLSRYGQLAQGVAGGLGALGSLFASGQQADALNRSIDTQSGYLNMLNAQQAPYRAAGYTALGQLGDLTAAGVNSPLLRPFGPGDLNTHLAPNYAFMRDQGLGATQNLLNAQGGSISGNTLKGLTDYGTNYAGNAYQQAYTNYNTNQANIFNRLASIAGLGQTANQQSVQGTSALGPPIGQTIGNLGTAQAAGTMGAVNAASGAANNALGWYALPQFLGQGG